MTDSTDNNTQDNNTVPSFDEVLASAGMSVSVRKRLTIAPSVVKAFADKTIARVVLLGTESKGNDVYVKAIAATAGTLIVSDLDASTAAMSAHVNTALKTRKIGFNNNALKNADNVIIGRVLSRPTVKS